MSELHSLLLSFIRPIAAEDGRAGGMAGEGEKKLTELPSDVSLPGNSCTSFERLRRRIQMRQPPTGGARKANSFIYLFFIYFFILLLSEKKGTSPTHPPPTAPQCLEWRRAAEMLTGEGGSLSEVLAGMPYESEA